MKDLFKLVLVMVVSMSVATIGLWTMNISNTYLYNICIYISAILITFAAAIDARLLRIYYFEKSHGYVLKWLGLLENGHNKLLKFVVSLWLYIFVVVSLNSVIGSGDFGEVGTIFYAGAYVILGLIAYTALRSRMGIQGLKQESEARTGVDGG